MTTLAALLPDENILLDLDLPGRSGLFHEAGRLFERRYGLPAATVSASLDARERVGSTGLGQGVAIPHARMRGLQHAIAAFVRARVPIAFDAPDGKPVSDFLVLLVPLHATEEHLQILAEAAARFGDRQFRERLRECDTAGAARALFAEPVPA